MPTLRELLTHPKKRKPKFCVGNREYDPHDVGFKPDFEAAEKGACPDGMVFDTSPAGNHNTGHAYGTDLGKAEIDQLINYLKKL